MEMSAVSRFLWLSGAVGVISTTVSGFLFYSLIRLLKFGNVSLTRSLLTSVSCTAAIVLGFAIPAGLSLLTCSFVAQVLLLLGVILGIVVTFPIQFLIFRLSAGAALVLWIAYIIVTPLVICWTALLLGWIAPFR